MKLAYNSHFLCKFATMKAKNILFTLLAFLGLSIGCTAQETVKTLEPKEFITAFNADTTAILLDVRKPAVICRRTSLSCHKYRLAQPKGF